MEDQFGNSFCVRPHWLMMEEICGVSIDDLCKEYSEKHPNKCFRTKFQKMFVKICRGRKFTLDFLISDESFGWTRLNPRIPFAVQIHGEGKLDPISYDRIYIKTTKRRNIY